EVVERVEDEVPPAGRHVDAKVVRKAREVRDIGRPELERLTVDDHSLSLEKRLHDVSFRPRCALAGSRRSTASDAPRAGTPEERGLRVASASRRGRAWRKCASRGTWRAPARHAPGGARN